MRKLFTYVGLFPILFLFVSCCYTGNCDDELNVNSYSPVIITRAALEASVIAEPQQNIFQSGKIYIKENLMFITDVNKGFHVYDYSNPENPVKTAFIKVPGATDLAIRNDIIYINQAVDLVTIKYNASTNSINSLHRNRNVFPSKVAPNGQMAYTNNDDVVINWTRN